MLTCCFKQVLSNLYCSDWLSPKVAVHYSDMRSSMTAKTGGIFQPLFSAVATKLFSLLHFLALLLPYWFILHLLVCSPPESRYLIPTSPPETQGETKQRQTPSTTHTKTHTVASVLNSPVSLHKEIVPNRRWRCCCVPLTLSLTLCPSLTFTHWHQHAALFSLLHKDSHLKYSRKTHALILLYFHPSCPHTHAIRGPCGCMKCVIDLLQEYSHYYWPDLAFSTRSSNQELSITDFCTLTTVFFHNLCQTAHQQKVSSGKGADR